jgi:hypothetical protein
MPSVAIQGHQKIYGIECKKDLHWKRVSTALMPAFSAPRHPMEPENTEALRGAGALEQRVRLLF